MRSLFVFLFFIGLINSSYSQSCMTFQKMEKNGIRMSQLDSNYTNAIHVDETKAAFKGKQAKKFDKAWGNYFSELMQYFADHDLVWGDPTYCFNKIYFSKDGKVDYWFFNFKKTDNIAVDKQEKYEKLMTEFSKSYPIKIKANTNFTQCASVTFFYLDKKKK